MAAAVPGGSQEVQDVEQAVEEGGIVVKKSLMDEEMFGDFLNVIQEALERYTTEVDQAEHIKKAFDDKHGPTWHCIVGTNFGSYVTHEGKSFAYVYVDKTAVLLFKAGGK